METNRPISAFLPAYEESKRLNADVPRSLYRRVNIIRNQRRLHWKDLLTGLFNKFVEDMEPKKTNEVYVTKPKGPAQASFL